MSRRLVTALVALVVFSVLTGACGSTNEPSFASGLEVVAEDGLADDASEPDPDCDTDNPTRSIDPGVDALADFGDPPPSSGLAEIQQRGVLRAGVGVDTLLFGYLNPRSAEIEGFDVEIARLVADRLGVEIELVPVQSPERLDRLEDETVDIVVKTMTITCDRWGRIDFSSVYFEAGQKLLVSTDMAEGITTPEDLGDATVCALPGTTSLQRLEEPDLAAQGLTTITSDTWTGCLVKFQQGEADAVSTDDTILAGLAFQDPYAEVVGDAFSSEPYGIGVSKDNPDLTRFVNAVLQEARTDGTWEDLYETWLVDTLGQAPPPPSASYR